MTDKPDQQSTDALPITWHRDEFRDCYEGWHNGLWLCTISREGRGAMPWRAWYSSKINKLASWHRTMRDAKAACEERHEREV